MKFTYDSYRYLLKLLREHGYEICSYHNWRDVSKSVILRHDIDYNLEKAVDIACIENELGVSST